MGNNEGLLRKLEKLKSRYIDYIAGHSGAAC